MQTQSLSSDVARMVRGDAWDSRQSNHTVARYVRSLARPNETLPELRFSLARRVSPRFFGGNCVNGEQRPSPAKHGVIQGSVGMERQVAESRRPRRTS